MNSCIHCEDEGGDMNGISYVGKVTLTLGTEPRSYILPSERKERKQGEG